MAGSIPNIKLECLILWKSKEGSSPSYQPFVLTFSLTGKVSRC